jgi:hypothetical protein
MHPGCAYMPIGCQFVCHQVLFSHCILIQKHGKPLNSGTLYLINICVYVYLITTILIQFSDFFTEVNDFNIAKLYGISAKRCTPCLGTLPYTKWFERTALMSFAPYVLGNISTVFFHSRLAGAYPVHMLSPNS